MESVQNGLVKSTPALEQYRGRWCPVLFVFILVATVMRFLVMQAGFGMLEAGSIRSKNAKNILLKNVVDVAIGGLIFWILGYALAYGSSNPFVGGSAFFFAGQSDYVFWLFQFAFAATAATIVSGAMAERTKFRAYMIYTVCISGFIYPIVVHWVWSGEGFLSQFNSGTMKIGPGMIDFAGSGVVHMTGGAIALTGAVIVGPRRGRFVYTNVHGTTSTFTDYMQLKEAQWLKKGGKWSVQQLAPHNAAASVLGVFILWFGWYGFNAGSTLGFSGGLQLVAERVAVTTTLSASAGALASFLVTLAIEKASIVALDSVTNGALAGLVGITAGCSVVDLWAAVVIGSLSGVLYVGASNLLLKMKIDDPLDAAPIHCFVGALGVFLVGFFAHPLFVADAYRIQPCLHFYNSTSQECSNTIGVFYGGNGSLLGVQVFGILCILLWSIITSGILFMILKRANLLRVTSMQEMDGLDHSKHGGYAYPDFKNRTSEKDDIVHYK